jgi:asparagine synthase (glutamine-hydrolysing)
MLSASRRRGDAACFQQADRALLGVAATVPNAAHEGGLTALVDDGECVVVADATLYYRQDLAARLKAAGSPAKSGSACDLILAAYHAWGTRCAAELEGDFAFALWDRGRRMLVAARDFAGRRPLFVGEIQDGVVVASSIESILQHPGFKPELDLGAVGADAAGLIFSSDDRTSYRGITQLGSAQMLVWTPGNAPVRSRYWSPERRGSATTSFDDGAAELLELLVASTRERLAEHGATTVWMSGGRDSTSVFAAGQLAIRRGATNGQLIPISRSHPVGDSGREDEAIAATAAMWDATPRWICSNEVPMFGDTRVASARQQAFAQPFEGLTRALARSSAAAGSNVALDGYGGDFLFQVSLGYLADLFKRGRVAKVLRDWRALGGSDWRALFRWAVQPTLPAPVLAAAKAIRGGRPLFGPLDRTTPPWMRDGFVKQHGLLERARATGPESLDGSHVERETAWYLTHPYFARVNAMMSDFTIAHNVELRSPLFDQRVVRFALGRPREERNDAGDRKRLLRHSMRGLLPNVVLERRRWKTGTLTDYFAREMMHTGMDLLESVARDPRLGDLGVINPTAFQQAVSAYRATPRGYPHTESLYLTLQAELWLRARSARVSDGNAVLSSGERPDTYTPKEEECKDLTAALSMSGPAWSDSARYAS